MSKARFKKILLTGASGLLGSNLKELLLKQNTILTPSSKDMNICSPKEVKEYFDKNQGIDLVIHCAAYTDVKKAQKDFIRCADTNIVGTFNILQSCADKNIKMVFISTDAVFNGKKGFYKITDLLDPVSNYAKTKTAAELLVRTYENSLIVRTSFFGKQFPYEKAFTNQWTSKDYIDVMAPKIYEKVISNKRGIVHVFSKRRSLYELALMRKKNVVQSSLDDVDFGFDVPRDLSLTGE